MPSGRQQNRVTRMAQTRLLGGGEPIGWPGTGAPDCGGGGGGGGAEVMRGGHRGAVLRRGWGRRAVVAHAVAPLESVRIRLGDPTVERAVQTPMTDWIRIDVPSER